MKRSWRVGFSFGLTSGIITTLGLMVGLASGIGGKLVVLGGIVTIAIADALSDALGVHVSEEAAHGQKGVWQVTGVTFLSKFVFALTFVVPVLLFSLQTALFVSVIWAFILLSSLSYFIAKYQGEKPIQVIGEHVLIAIIVVVATYFVGSWVGGFA